MKKLRLIAFLFTFAWAASCSKDDPAPENDQEEVGAAELIFTEVERELHGDHYHYHAVENADTDTVRFDDKGLPPAGVHLHLEVDKTYRLDLKARDFAGRETQQTFVQRDDIHQAFILNAPAGALEYAYGDEKDGTHVNVGVKGYLTVLKTSDTFVMRYVMRHLNPGVKAGIKATDWNSADFTRFTGANDLDLKVEVHLVAEHDHHD